MEVNYKELAQESELVEIISNYNKTEPYIILDLETTGLDPRRDKITDIVFTDSKASIAYICKPEFAATLHDLLIPVVCHNFRFDFNFLSQIGVNLRLEHDTMLLDHLLDENAEHGLDAIVQRRYQDDYKKQFWDTYKNYTDAPKEAQELYAVKDVLYTARLYNDLKRDLESDGIPNSLLQHVYNLALTLYETEKEGIQLDLPYLSNMGNTLLTRINALKIEMRDLVDLECTILENRAYIEILEAYKTDKGRAKAKPPEPFNFESSTQLAKLIYDELKLPVQLNKQRNRTCDDAALERIEGSHAVVRLLREFRGHQKVYGSFIEGSLNKMHEGRIYPSFNINGTVTGRISSSGPNMQQLPSEGGVRGIYVPPSGYKLISCDYSQLEVVVAAHYSQDKNLLRIIHEGVSKHDITNEGLGLNNRHLAKTINFAAQYQCTPKKIASLVGCSDKEGEVIWNKYWETYAGERKVVDECIAKVKAGTPIINLFGRRRRFLGLEDLNHWQREACYRQAYSSLIQGSGADITSEALYTVNGTLLARGLGKALFTVHDELMIVSKDEHCEESAHLVKSIMEAVGSKYLSVPLKAQVSKPMLRWSKE